MVGRADGTADGTADAWRERRGRRVVVRHRVPSGGLTDAVGELVDVTDAALVVRTARGDVVVDRVAVVAGKVVPPRPARAAPAHLALSVTDLVAVMAGHWNPQDATRLGGWWLRAAAGFTNRANCVVPLGDPGVGDDAAEAFVRRWYGERGLPAQASIAGPVTGGVPDGPDSPAARAGALLRARGWAAVPDASALVLVAPTGELRAGPALPAGLTLDTTAAPDAGWLGTYRYRGRELPGHAVDVLTSGPEQLFVSVRDTGRTVAVARGSLGAGWAGLTAVEVDAGYRRRGLARVLLSAVARWAWGRGALSTFLQTAESNTVARRLYLSAGFVPHHRYDYLREPTA